LKGVKEALKDDYKVAYGCLEGVRVKGLRLELGSRLPLGKGHL
jgi:hypothetical protein